MVIINIKVVTLKNIIENGYIEIENKKIKQIGKMPYLGIDNNIVDGKNQIAMPGFIDIHIHGSCGIDFLDAKEDDYQTIANALYSEGVTSFLATTLTSDSKSLIKVCKEVYKAKKHVSSLAGIHLEGPYISLKYKGAQNEKYIRNPNKDELAKLIKASHKNIRYITLAPEKQGAYDFIEYATNNNVVVSVGHSDATFKEVEGAISHGLTNTTHTHNAMSGHHHRKPGVLTAAFYFDCLYREFICDGIHVCDDVLKTSYKIIGPDRFIIITDALQAKHSDKDHFKLFGMDCIVKDGAAYLEKEGNLAGSLLTFDKAIQKMKALTDASLVDIAKIASTNAANSIHLKKNGQIRNGYFADIVLLSDDLKVKEVYKNGEKVY